MEILQKIPGYNGLLRLVGYAIFKTPTGWTELEDVIIDTGAHTSILPRWLWIEIEREKIADHYVRGLVPKEECIMDVEVAWVTVVLLDARGNRTPEIKFRAYLTLTDEIPIVLGFKDLLDRLILHLDYGQKIAYVEEKE